MKMKIENKNEKLFWLAMVLSYISLIRTLDFGLTVFMGWMWLVLAILFLWKLKTEKGDQHGRKMGK